MDSYSETFQTWDKVAALYQERFMDLDLYNATYHAFCQLLAKPKAKIFEIGCGPGNVTNYLLSERPDFDIEAIDISPAMLKLASQNNPTTKFQLLDAREIGKVTSTFDGIMCGFCLPYLSKTDCSKLLRDCFFLLNSGGILYVSTIEGDYQTSGYETGSGNAGKMYVYYYQEEYLRAELESNGFEVVELIRKDFQKSDNTTSTHLIFIARRK